MSRLSTELNWATSTDFRSLSLTLLHEVLCSCVRSSKDTFYDNLDNFLHRIHSALSFSFTKKFPLISAQPWDGSQYAQRQRLNISWCHAVAHFNYNINSMEHRHSLLGLIEWDVPYLSISNLNQTMTIIYVGQSIKHGNQKFIDVSEYSQYI